MKIQTAQTANKSGVFSYLLLLTGFFFLLEISFFIQTNKAYLFDFNFVSSNLHIPMSVMPDILKFVIAQLLVHTGYCLFIFLVARMIKRVILLQEKMYFKVSLGLWLLGMATILTANQYLFPNSKFAELSAMLWWDRSILNIALSFFISLSLVCLLIAGIGFLRVLGLKKVTAIFFIGLVSYFVYFKQQMQIPTHTVSSQPNIIIIGVDSLRPDFLGCFGADSNTPSFDRFLDQASVFSEAVTPLARTFPSWLGILSGEYPKQIGIRFNLARQDGADFSQTLPALLQKQGYKTIFATDETRFSNIDTHFGFDQTVTTPIGLNDFLLGTFNDFPISNLLVNTKIGQWLFPYSYANRAAFVTYLPNTFLHHLTSVLNQAQPKPIFLAVHFCLPHYPYLWAKQDLELNWIKRYQNTVERADQQVGDLLHWLQANQLLQHAIVIVLSDHGEALELQGDRITNAELYTSKTPIPQFYPPSLDAEAVNQSAGHGTDVLSLSQYHTLLAIKLYGMQQQPKIIDGMVSLLDIKPTILDFLHQPFSGTSLKPFIENNRILPSRDIFLESDYTPDAIRTLYPETRNVMLEGIALFRIDPVTTRLVVKDSMGEKIIRSKQLADIYQNWMLALYPQNQFRQTPILVNLNSGQWTNDMHSTFAQHSPYMHMLKALSSFYGSEIDRELR